MMEFNGEQGKHCGNIPEFGAIFMSNSSTMKECLKRRLFGLPLGHSDFVREVKSGMILFLFEFERRQLHGVFQASADGAINIVRNAYKSSGKQFPAQVKFVRLWNCRPLSEKEFRGAIKENYYSPNKFRFGLSESQVRKLLGLFSSRKLGTKNPQGQTKQSNVSLPSPVNEFTTASDKENIERIDPEDCMNNQGETDDNRLATTTACNEYRGCALRTSTEHSGEQLGELRDLVDLFLTSAVREQRDLDFRYKPASNNSSARNEWDNDGAVCGTSNVLGNRLNGGIDLEPPTSTQDTHLHRNRPVDHASQVVSEPRNKEVYQESSSVHHLVDPQSSAPFFPSSHKDALPFSNIMYPSTHTLAGLTGTPQYDPDAPSIFGTSLFADPCNCILPSINVLPFSSGTKPNAISASYQNVSNSYLLVPEYPEIVSRPHATVDSKGLVLYTPRVSSSPSLDGEKIGNSKETGISCSIGPSNSPSFVSDSSWSEEKHDGKVVHSENSSVIATCLGTKNRDQSQSPTMIADFYENSGTLYADTEIRRPSVFSRLAMPTRQDNDVNIVNDESDIDTSVNELMNSLYQNKYQWLRPESLNPETQKHADVAASSGSKQESLNSSSLNFHSVSISEEIETDVPPSFEETDVQAYEQVPFIDFKRRRKVQQTQENAGSDSDGSTRAQQKRRKLVRPKLDDIASAGGSMIDTQKNINKVAQVAFMLHIHDKDYSKDLMESNHKGEKSTKSLVVSCHGADDANKAQLPVDSFNVSLSGKDQNLGKQGDNGELPEVTETETSPKGEKNTRSSVVSLHNAGDLNIMESENTSLLVQIPNHGEVNVREEVTNQETNAEGEKNMRSSVDSCYNPDESNKALPPIVSDNMNNISGKEGVNFEHSEVTNLSEQFSETNHFIAQQGTHTEKAETMVACYDLNHGRGENAEITTTDDKVTDVNTGTERNTLESRAKKRSASIIQEILKEASRRRDRCLGEEKCREGLDVLKSRDDGYDPNGECRDYIPL